MKKLLLIPDLSAVSPREHTLSPQRAQRAALLHSPQERHRFAAAEALTCRLLTRFFGICDPEILGGPGQKPQILGQSGVSFSRSYCADSLVIAAEDAPCIGVDCEMLRPVDERVMKYFFTPREQDFVRSCPDPRLGFALIWTRKEAYIKCTGDGLCFPWNTLETAPAQIDLAACPLCRENTPAGGLFLNSYAVADRVISVCSPKNDRFPQVLREWSLYEKDDP